MVTSETRGQIMVTSDTRVPVTVQNATAERVWHQIVARVSEDPRATVYEMTRDYATIRHVLTQHVIWRNAIDLAAGVVAEE
jgi:hypothetical protein